MRKKQSRAKSQVTGIDVLLMMTEALRDSGQQPGSDLPYLFHDFLTDHVGATMKGPDAPEIKVASKPRNAVEVAISLVVCGAAKFAFDQRDEVVLEEAIQSGIVMAMRVVDYEGARDSARGSADS
jgi:hypothetical protein